MLKFPGLVVEPILFTLVVYWIAGLRATLYAFGFTALLSILVLNVAIACGKKIIIYSIKVQFTYKYYLINKYLVMTITDH